MKKNDKLVIIGGGIAGVSAAQAARNEYPGASITLLSAEPYPFYNKIALNTFVTGKRRQRHLHFYELDWLHTQRIEPRWGTTVEGIDTDRHQLLLDDGVHFDYDKLILATGAKPARPPIQGIDSHRVFSLWTLSDAIALREALSSAKNVYILGAGVLGVESALDLARAGMQVTLTDVQGSVLPLHLDDEASKLYRDSLARRGVELSLGTTVVSIESTETSAQITTADGDTRAVDVVLTLTGVQPNAELARQAGLRCDRGILVDDALTTSDPDILACGNCVELGGELRLLWNPAKAQGEVAGLNAFSRKRTARALPPIVHVKTPDIPLFVAGDPRSTGGDVIVDQRPGSYRKITLSKDNRIESALLLGDTQGAWELEKAIVAQKTTFPTAREVDEIIAELRNEEDIDDRVWVCQMCGYTHEGDEPPGSCPVCAVGRDQFLAA